MFLKECSVEVIDSLRMAVRLDFTGFNDYGNINRLNL